ncbi:MAG: DUF1343 domain-containing protein [Chitinophagales bacterium]|nr:DUF1343 domain-containing protein [Chitinophagales bacterium]HAE36062.1 DUF1343 domain-containing protein [Bacteroidota bacterium]MCB9020300.1 DUF1343 domain-containing protein [Chitinophagales bacterium]MCB9022349.1 DUF1343 domain-containing protein [Chitinophagales bacterium]HPE97518.1 DUF1343 domain-containing protein [Chitinophagales bacterium]
MISQILLVLTIWSAAACKNSDSVEASGVVASGPEPAAIQVGAQRTSEYYPLLAGKRVGVVVNQTSMIGNTLLPEALQGAGFEVTAIFAPEHGFRGEQEAGESVSNGKDQKTGIPIVSIYGKRKKPTAADMKEVDIMIFDIQDVGARFYTYISTMTYVMEACAENNIPLIVLDRPNPNGFYVDGPVRRTGYESFVGIHPVPIVHGMTVGEYAKMVNGEGWLSGGLTCELTVITCEGYDHKMKYDLPVPPSPNLKTMRSIYLYPSLCLFEGTNFSVGRGTPDPFSVVGSPYVRGYRFSFVPSKKFSRSEPVFEDETCYGIDLRTMPIDSVADGRIHLEYLMKMYKAFDPGQEFFRSDGFFDKLAGNDVLAEQLRARLSEEEIRLSWQDELIRFKAIRKKYLLYPDFE